MPGYGGGAWDLGEFGVQWVEGGCRLGVGWYLAWLFGLSGLGIELGFGGLNIGTESFNPHHHLSPLVAVKHQVYSVRLLQL